MDSIELLFYAMAFCIGVAWAAHQVVKATKDLETTHAKLQQDLRPQFRPSVMTTTHTAPPLTTRTATIRPLPREPVQVRFDEQLLQRLQGTSKPVYDKIAMLKWARSIITLIRQAEFEINDAQLQLKTEDYRSATSAVTAALEYMTKAVLYCFGEKPDAVVGELEPLKLVSLRLKEQERLKFDECIEQISRIYMIEEELENQTNQETETLLNTKNAPCLVDSAAKIVKAFRETLAEHFGAEIPELYETCPKCKSIYIEMWNIERTSVTYVCRLCRHIWEQTRNTW